jgi:sulfur carrier protein ThiS
MKEAIGALETWADDADPQNTDAIVGAKTIVSAERERASDIRQEVPNGNTSLLQKFDNLTERLEKLADTIEPLEFSTTGYVVYVNQQFVDRYDASSGSVETILLDADKKDPDELGLFPLDGLLGNRQEDQAFPAERDLDLSDEYRTFFESTSDGGKIAYE